MLGHQYLRHGARHPSQPIRETKQPVLIYFAVSTSREAEAGLFSSTNNSKGHVVIRRWFVEASGSF